MGKDGHHDKSRTGLPVWDLRGLFLSKDSPAFEKALKSIEDEAQSFSEKFKNRVVKLSGRALGLAIAEYEKLMAKADAAYGYLDLLETEDSSNASFAGGMRDRLNRATSGVHFFTLDINKIRESDLLDKISAPELGKYAPWMRKVRSLRDHQLEDDVEKYLHEKRSVAEGAWERLYDMTLSGLRFDLRGKKLTGAETLHIINSSDDAALRREAHNELTRVLSENKTIFALIINTMTDLKKVNDGWRVFQKPEDSRHLDNGVDREAIDAMVQAVKESYPKTAHRYYAWKAKKLGGALLHPADCNAPLPGAKTGPIEWEEAKKTVLESFAGLSPDMADIGRKFFDDNKIDAALRAGNKSGSGFRPMTLARELGHGIRQVLVNEQGYLKSQTPPPLAEAAAIFGEMLVFRTLLDQEEDLLQKRALLASKIEDMLDNTVRQTAFFSFERKLHAERGLKGEVPVGRIAQLWQETQKEALGPAVNLDVEGAENLWTHVPHFVHGPFYACSRAFGSCLAGALLDVYDRAADKKDFADKYVEFLKAGGSKGLDTLLAPFGLDVSEPAFWKKGVTLLERYIDELEKLDLKIDAVLKSKDVFKAAANDIVLPPDTGQKPEKTVPKGPVS